MAKAPKAVGFPSDGLGRASRRGETREAARTRRNMLDTSRGSKGGVEFFPLLSPVLLLYQSPVVGGVDDVEGCNKLKVLARGPGAKAT